MRISLNGIVDLVAAMAGRPFDVPLQEQLKSIVNYKRADWIQKVVDKHPEQRKYFLKDFSAPLTQVDEAECPVDIGCNILRTISKIPLPTRTQETLFDYVGDPDKFDAYTYTTPDQVYWMNNFGSRYTKDRPKYFYVNGYIYIYNDDSLENINVRGLWPDQKQLNQFKCGTVACYTDDDQYDIPDDIINTMIQDILKNEFRIYMKEQYQDEITTDDKSKETK